LPTNTHFNALFTFLEEDIGCNAEFLHLGLIPDFRCTRIQIGAEKTPSMSAKRTLPTLVIGHVADAAFV
jgi:hypothetical protein